MPDLLIRDIDPVLKRQLEEQAESHGRSLSEEAKVLLRLAIAQPVPEPGLGTRLFSLLPDEFRGDDLVFEIPGDVSEPPDFS